MSHLMNTVKKRNIMIDGASGSWLHAENGKKYLDWFTDSGTVNVGYKPKELMIELPFLPQHLPNSVNSIYNETAAELLCIITNMDKAFFCNSGSETVEAAIKIARKWNYNNKTGKTIIYTHKGGFHGRSYGSISAGDGPAYHYIGFGPHLEGFKTFSELSEIDFNEAAAVLMEPIYGANDVILYPKEYIQELRRLTTENNIPLLFDEVQSGSGRTGHFTASQYYGITPDVICLAKGVACGITTGVTLAKGEFADVFEPGTHYSTFGGSPHSCFGVIHLIKLWNETDLQKNIADVGAKLYNGLTSIEQSTGKISNIRGVGLWVAIDVVDEKAIELSDVMLEHGLFCPTFRNNILKFSPMLNSTVEEINLGLYILSQSIKQVWNIE